MKLVSVLKRSQSVHELASIAKCLFCQSNTGHLLTASTDGKIRMKIVAEQRRKYDDTIHLKVLESISQEQLSLPQFIRHKSFLNIFFLED